MRDVLAIPGMQDAVEAAIAEIEPYLMGRVGRTGELLDAISAEISRREYNRGEVIAVAIVLIVDLVTSGKESGPFARAALVSAISCLALSAASPIRPGALADLPPAGTA